MNEPLVFRSKMDGWLMGLLLIAPVALSIAFVSAAAAGETGAAISVAVGLVLSSALLGWIVSSTRYVVARGELVAQSGPFAWTVRLADIHSVEPSRSLMSAPALSVDRLAIRHGNGGVLLVSPKDKQGFLAALGQGRR